MVAAPLAPVSGMKTDWMKRLWLACSMAHGHRLRDRNRSQTNTNVCANTITVKQGKVIQAGAPWL